MKLLLIALSVCAAVVSVSGAEKKKPYYLPPASASMNAAFSTPYGTSGGAPMQGSPALSGGPGQSLTHSAGLVSNQWTYNPSAFTAAQDPRNAQYPRFRSLHGASDFKPENEVPHGRTASAAKAYHARAHAEQMRFAQQFSGMGQQMGPGMDMPPGMGQQMGPGMGMPPGMGQQMGPGLGMGPGPNQQSMPGDLMQEGSGAGMMPSAYSAAQRKLMLSIAAKERSAAVHSASAGKVPAAAGKAAPAKAAAPVKAPAAAHAKAAASK